jgi:hypothetical protein
MGRLWPSVTAQRLIDLTPRGVRRRPANFGDAADDIVRASAAGAPSRESKSGLYRQKPAKPAPPERLGTC